MRGLIGRAGHNVAPRAMADSATDREIVPIRRQPMVVQTVWAQTSTQNSATSNPARVGQLILLCQYTYADSLAPDQSVIYRLMFNYPVYIGHTIQFG